MTIPTADCRCYWQWCGHVRVPNDFQANKSAAKSKNKDADLLSCGGLTYSISYDLCDLPILQTSEFHRRAAAVTLSENL